MRSSGENDAILETEEVDGDCLQDSGSFCPECNATHTMELRATLCA